MSERDARLYCSDILDSGNAILEFIKGMDYGTFCKDRKTYSAVIREFEIIGEAVDKLPEELKQRRSDVEWQDIKDFRNLLTHEYFGVDLEIVWKVILDDLPALLDAIRGGLIFCPLVFMLTSDLYHPSESGLPSGAILHPPSFPLLSSVICRLSSVLFSLCCHLSSVIRRLAVLIVRAKAVFRAERPVLHSFSVGGSSLLPRSLLLTSDLRHLTSGLKNVGPPKGVRYDRHRYQQSH